MASDAATRWGWAAGRCCAGCCGVGAREDSRGNHLREPWPVSAIIHTYILTLINNVT